jgi:DNA repair protein RadC
MTDENETPLRERLLADGAGDLSEIELLTLILRTGAQSETASDLAEQVMAHFGDLRALSGAQLADLDALKCLRPAQSASVVAALELARRLINHRGAVRPIIETAEDAAALVLAEMSALKQEQLRVMLLDVHRRVIAIPTVYLGSLNMTVVRAAEVFREAIARNCASIILLHNHPSGDATPSAADLQLTEDLVAAGRLLDIAVLDHIVIGAGEWSSLRDTGMNF